MSKANRSRVVVALALVAVAGALAYACGARMRPAAAGAGLGPLSELTVGAVLLTMDACRCSKLKTTGTKKRVAKVATIRPPMTARPNGAFCSPPSPSAKVTFTAYPNPTNGWVRFSAPQSGQFELYDVLGRRVRTRDVLSGSEAFELDLRNLASGTYVFRFVPKRPVSLSPTAGTLQLIR